MVFQYVVHAFLAVQLFYYGEHAIGAYKVGKRLFCGVFPIVFGDVFAHAHVVLCSCYVSYIFHHADALLVVAVCVGQRAAAFGDGLHLVEARVGDLLGGQGEHAFGGRRALHGVGTGGLPRHPGEVGIGKHGLPVGLLVGHASKRVVDDLAVRRAKVYVGQAVHLVVVEGLLKIAEVVLSAG